MGRTERLRGRKNNRGETPKYLLKFLENFHKPAKLMHSSLNLFKGNSEMIEQASRQYIISITSCLETFYRDLYVALLEEDPRLFHKLLSDRKFKDRLSAIRSKEPADISDAELMGELAKFQNISGIDAALSSVMHPQNYLKLLSTTEFSCIIPSRRPDLALFKMWPDWKEQLSRIFDHRHEFAHDASSLSIIELKDMAKIEATALVVPQLTALLVSKTLGAKFPLLAMDGVAVILLAEDLIADDWVIS